MEYYLKLEDLGFGMASPLVYSKALKKSGFVAIKTNNRNKLYKDESRRELKIKRKIIKIRNFYSMPVKHKFFLKFKI